MATAPCVAIILADGDQSKWDGHLGMPRHFVEVDGERILDRTVRQLSGQAEVIISAPDNRYQLPGTSLFTPRHDPDWLDADILLATRSLWNAQGRTLIVLGDVRFTDEAMRQLLDERRRSWAFYGRERPSTVTGTGWGEIFAWAFWPRHIRQFASASDEVLRLRQAGDLWRAGPWELYRLLEHLDPLEHRVRGHFVEIDDWTDDVDFPYVYEEFMRRWRAAHPAPSS